MDGDAHDMPIDKIRKIIEFQFDLEMLYKREELKLIQNQIKKGELILDTLKQLIYYGNFLASVNAFHFCMLSVDYSMREDIHIPNNSHQEVLTLLNNSEFKSLLSSQHAHYNSKKLESRIQYEMKSDGTFVK